MLKFILIFTVFATSVLADQLTRPCKYDDLKCIQLNFKANSRCNPNVKGSIPGAYILGTFKFDTPYFNATYIDNDLVIRNHNHCKVSEFFFNVPADSALLSLDCPGLTFESNRTLIQHYPKRQDTYYSYEIQSYYPHIQLTVDIKHANVIDLCSTFTFAYVTDIPIINVTPNDKSTANALTRDLSYMNIFSREEVYTRANQLLRTYVNTHICDFGCNA